MGGSYVAGNNKSLSNYIWPVRGGDVGLAGSLNILKSGTGIGSITSVPEGISCGFNCGAIYATGTNVTLTSTPDISSSFTNWIGCDSYIDNYCTLNISGAKIVTATFSIQTYQLSVNISGTSGGTVGSSPIGIACTSNTCLADFVGGTTVTLSAVPDPTSIFTGWSGACTGTGSTCNVYIDEAKNVTASFAVRPKYDLLLNFAGDGVGQVNGDINCTSETICPSNQFLLGVTAFLYHTPDVNSLFGGWSGACNGLGNCGIFMDASKSVTATFVTGTPVKVIPSNKTYNFLQEAYDDNVTESGSTIMGRAVSLSENLTLNRPVNIIIQGGYDVSFQNYFDLTGIHGYIVIKNGGITVDRLVIW